MSSNYINGKTIYFGTKNADEEPIVYIKPNKSQTLQIDANITGNAATATTATYATSSGTASGPAEYIEKTGTPTSVNIVVQANINDTLPTGTAYKGCSISVDNNDLFIGNPGDTRNGKKGTLSYYKRVAGAWVYDSYLQPSPVFPACAAIYSYWGYSVSHKNDFMCVSSPSIGGSETGVATYKKIAGTWTHQASNNIGGSLCHTDGTNCAGWFSDLLSTDVDIGDNTGALVRTIVAPATTNSCWVHSGEVAIASSTGVLGIYNIGTGALTTTYSADSVFGHLVSMNTTYIVSVGLDKRSLVVVLRSDGSYYASFKMDFDIKFIKLEGSCLVIAGATTAKFYYDNGLIFFDSNAYVSYTRSDDTTPFASLTWPNILDFDSTTGSLVYGEPMTSTVYNYNYSEASKSTTYGFINIYSDVLGIYPKERRVIVSDNYLNPITVGTTTLYAKGMGSEKVFTGTAKITDTTAASSVSTGSLINAGGIGNTGRVYTTDLTCVNSIVGKNSYCSVYSSSTVASSSGIAVLATYTTPTTVKNTTDFTVDANGIITVAEAGTYLISGYVNFASNATGYRESFFQLTGGSFLGSTIIGNMTQNAINGAAHTITSSMFVNLTANTTVGLYAYQNSTSSINVFGTLSICRVVA